MSNSRLCGGLANGRWALTRAPLLVQEELENFPLSIIHLSQTVLNRTRYPSVLLLVCQDRDQHKPDIHFFHCDEVDVSLAGMQTRFRRDGSKTTRMFTSCISSRPR